MNLSHVRQGAHKWSSLFQASVIPSSAGDAGGGDGIKNHIVSRVISSNCIFLTSAFKSAATSRGFLGPRLFSTNFTTCMFSQPIYHGLPSSLWSLIPHSTLTCLAFWPMSWERTWQAATDPADPAGVSSFCVAPGAQLLLANAIALRCVAVSCYQVSCRNAWDSKDGTILFHDPCTHGR